MASGEVLRVVTMSRLKAADPLMEPADLALIQGSIDDEVKAAYNDACEKTITAFLSIIAGGFSEHVVMWNYTKLRDYLRVRAGLVEDTSEQSNMAITMPDLKAIE